MNSKVRFTIVRVELPFANWVGQIKAARLSHALVVIVEIRDQVRAIELCRNVRRQTTTSQGFSREFRIRRSREKISAQREENFSRMVVHRLNRMHSVQAVSSRRFKTKLLPQAVEELRGRLLPNAHRTIALHVAVTAHGTQTGARLAHLSAQHH